jgi:hypothetical protein
MFKDLTYTLSQGNRIDTTYIYAYLIKIKALASTLADVAKSHSDQIFFINQLCHIFGTHAMVRIFGDPCHFYVELFKNQPSGCFAPNKKTADIFPFLDHNINP